MYRICRLSPANSIFILGKFRHQKKQVHPELTPDRLSQLSAIQQKISFSFRNIFLLDQAFTHRSYANESKFPLYDNERLEFLGDSILGFLTAEYLFQCGEDFPEGRLAKWKSKIVSRPSLVAICRELDFAQYVRFGKGESVSGKSNPKVMEDLIEALLGAIYLDRGLEACRTFFLPYIKKAFAQMGSDDSTADYKSILQELSQKKFKKTPRYELISEEGLDHDKVFQIRVILPDGSTRVGQGKNKRSAEQNAAKLLLNDWRKRK